jgi:hypothetical protein
VCVQQLARGGAVAVELLEVAVALRVVVAGVDHDLARGSFGRQLAVATEGHRHDDHVAKPFCLGSGRCLRSAAGLVDEPCQRLRAA